MIKYLIDKSDISSINIIDEISEKLGAGQVKFKLEKAALTANNISYAVLGERFKFWDFFPHSGGGILPVWGYAKVVETECDEVNIGNRFYGYYPLAEELIVQPVKINDYGFVDGKKHRQVLPQIYNYYENVNKNGVQKEMEAAYMVFQPLFATSFLLAHYFMDNDSFGGKQVFITSASSKTAMAFAAVLSHMDDAIELVGITSAKNVSFCESTELYHSIIDYESTGGLQNNAGVIVDFAGNRSILAKLQDQIFHSLKKSITVGLSHWDQAVGEEKLPFKSELFFAPDHAVRKQKEWGGKEFKVKLNKSLFPFLKKSFNWLQYNSSEDVFSNYEELVKGQVPPHQCIILKL